MNTRSGFFLIVGIFLISPLLAWMFHVGLLGNIKTSEGGNYGQLIHPARSLAGFSSVDVTTGAPVTIDRLLGLWTLLIIVDKHCAQSCLQAIYQMHQVRLATGKDAHRVQRVVLSAHPVPLGLSTTLAHYPGTRWLSIVGNASDWLGVFPRYQEGGLATVTGRLYLIDPLGNLMMYYPFDADPSGMLKDLRKLLRATWIRPTLTRPSL